MTPQSGAFGESPRVISAANKLQRQPHIPVTKKEKAPKMSEPSKPAEPLLVYTYEGLVPHATLTVDSIYDPNELFKDDTAIGKNGRQKFLIDPHRKGKTFEGCRFYQWKVLIAYIAQQENRTKVLYDWDMRLPLKFVRC